jgi:hypothetical protein
MMTERMMKERIQYHGQDLAWWQSYFSAGLVRLLMVQLQARARGRTMEVKKKLSPIWAGTVTTIGST